ncbi:hypothetical protein OPQ81_010492 [Rhizoctonia solani]|nr:hypothetical protein OPQ81_010492 [Rhizoctonia solani]
MASKNGSAKRGPRPSADPLHIAKRKKLIAEEFIHHGTHSNIRKTISWGDIGGHGADSPSKRARTSLSQSITPGLSDMSTPTPLNRPRSAMKPPSSQKSILVSPRNQPNTHSKRDSIGQPGSILRQSRPEFAFRAPSHEPTSQRPQTQPEVINLISDEIPQSDENPKTVNNGNKAAGASGPSSSRQATKPQPQAPSSPTSDAGTQYPEQATPDDDRPAFPGQVPLPYPNTGTAASQKRPLERSGTRATNSQSPVRPSSPSRRKRRTSEVGIQTIPDKEIDWLGDLDLDDSMSAIEVSRVWAERRSGPKTAGEQPHEIEPDEPLAGNFLDEFEGQPVNGERELQEASDAGHLEETDVAQESHITDEQNIKDQTIDRDGIPGRAPVSSQASSPLQFTEPPVNAASYPRPASSPLRFPSSPPYGNVSNEPGSSVQPYRFNIQERKSTSAPDRTQKDTNANQADTQPRPFSSSQPNPFVSGPRARSRLYTPQPAPPPRNMNLGELRAAPTLGRSGLGGTQLAVDSPKGSDRTRSAVAPDTPTKGSDSKAKTLRAAPTLGRSTDWGHVSPARSAATNSNDKNEPTSGHQPTDYGAEYGSVPEAPSTFASRPPSSPAHYAWEMEPVHASTPHRLVTQMSPMARDLTQENKSVKTTSLAESAQPFTLADLDKRRRSSVAPTVESKKIRREYDTVESNSVTNPRAHRDTYDDSGRRTWVPKRPSMKRALDAPTPSVKKVARSKYPAPVAEEPEPAVEARDQVLPESALESRPETFDPVPYGEPVQEHRVEQDEQPGQALGTEDRVPHPSTEIAETPQSARIRDPFDFTTSELHSNRFASEQAEPAAAPKPIDYAYVVPRNQLDASAIREDGLPMVNTAQKGEPTSTSAVQRHTLDPHVGSSRRTRSDGRSTKKSSSKLRRQSSGLHITPARQPIWSPPRTRLSIGGRSGISVLEVSKSDQDILVQAGLRPILKRLSQAHGFTVDVVADVYQETGSLKETEDTLEKMKHSAERMRVSISRRRSTLQVIPGEQRGSAEHDSSEASGANDDYLNWDTTRMSSRILFGEGL